MKTIKLHMVAIRKLDPTKVYILEIEENSLSNDQIGALKNALMRNKIQGIAMIRKEGTRGLRIIEGDKIDE